MVLGTEVMDWEVDHVKFGIVWVSKFTHVFACMVDAM